MGYLRVCALAPRLSEPIKGIFLRDIGLIFAKVPVGCSFTPLSTSSRYSSLHPRLHPRHSLVSLESEGFWDAERSNRRRYSTHAVMASVYVKKDGSKEDVERALEEAHKGIST